MVLVILLLCKTAVFDWDKWFTSGTDLIADDERIGWPVCTKTTEASIKVENC